MRKFWKRWRSAPRRGPTRPRRFRPVLECLEDRTVPSAPNDFSEVLLASDLPNMARVQDLNLVNPIGLAMSPTGPFWFAENGAGVSDILDGEGEIVPLVVGIPGANGSLTGTVFNGGNGFVISANGVSMPADFLFATQDGTIFGWNGNVNSSTAIEVVNNSASGASYTGLTLATNAAGQSFLYAANFASGAIDVFGQNFEPVVQPGAFHDPNLPAGFAPFNIQNIGNRLYVSYAVPNPASPGDEIAGAGLGFVDVYNTSGDLLGRLASGGTLNAPWGMTLAPANFGAFGGDLLVGNNGDGRINAFNPVTGAFVGQLADGNGAPITIPSLWALNFGNGFAGGNSSTLFFTAGLDNESHGLFGAIQPPQLQGADTGGTGAFNPNALHEAGNYPLPPVDAPSFPDTVNQGPAAVTVLLPWANSSLAMVPTLTPFGPSGIPVKPGENFARAHDPHDDAIVSTTESRGLSFADLALIFSLIEQSSRPTPLDEATLALQAPVEDAEPSFGLAKLNGGEIAEVGVPQATPPTATAGETASEADASLGAEEIASLLLAGGVPILGMCSLIYWRKLRQGRNADSEEVEIENYFASG